MKPRVVAVVSNPAVKKRRALPTTSSSVSSASPNEIHVVEHVCYFKNNKEYQDIFKYIIHKGEYIDLLIQFGCRFFVDFILLLFEFPLFQSCTVDLGEVKTAPTECKKTCFQMSHLPIFTILKHLKMCWC